MRSTAGRVLSFALVALLVMSAVGLAASQTFINKTGKTVTGIKVEFSKSVRITRHDSVFSDQDPSGHAQEFTFSGGELRNLGRFTITWLPSSGKVLDYEWIKKEQPAQTPQVTSSSNKQGSQLPDPNTPPILYGNDYPGPDEPLYQPAADEQIWLTDLDGHADVYDNDSIKINYAPGFDKSQITKIDVYRNGIKLRFLPDTFDVLTNAQMKTFDGNPAEHSPASNHSDHAIMGYEYKFEIHTADHVWMFTKTVKSGFRWDGKAYVGINGNLIAGFIKYNYSKEELTKVFKRLHNAGFYGLAFDIPYWVENKHPNKVNTLDHVDNSIIPGWTQTPTFEELDFVLKAAENAGLKVQIWNTIYVDKRYQDKEGYFMSGSFIRPDNANSFFTSYEKLTLEMAKFFEREGNVEEYIPFIEMDGLNIYSSYLKNFFTQISEVYSGHLGYENTTSNILNNASPFYNYSGNVSEITGDFWDWESSDGRHLDFMLDNSEATLETQKDQRLSVMDKAIIKFYKPVMDYIRNKYPSVDIKLCETWAIPQDGFNLGPEQFYTMTNRLSDYQEQSDTMSASIYWLIHENIKSAQFNYFDLYRKNQPYGGEGEIFFTFGTPAYKVITSAMNVTRK